MTMSFAVFFVLISLIAVVALAASPFVLFSIYANESQFLSEIPSITDLVANPNQRF